MLRIDAADEGPSALPEDPFRTLLTAFVLVTVVH